ncbi:hypothetical protein, partial [Kitasatospora sp. NPDC047058]|uniref:hypothetical protein n=1 Tax=Kitasatospora sp. NPDC047058 TaxID=3155620 RepID=UPI0033EE7D8B
GHADSAPAGASAARLRGSGDATLTRFFPGMEGDKVHLDVDVHTKVNNSPSHARGHFHVTHHRPDGQLVADLEGDLTCLAVGGRDAITTGVVTKAETPWFPGTGFVGTKVSLTVQDDGRADRLGWLLGAFGVPVADCQGTVPFIGTDHGNLTVRG